jgi:hypothetical protein
MSKSKPITKKEDIQHHPDKKIDQDYSGYPDGPAKDETIKPETKEERDIADVDNKDGEKRNYKKAKIDEQDSDGSANAFEEK